MRCWRGGAVERHWVEVFPYVSCSHLGWWISTTFWGGEKSSCYVQFIIQACKNEGLVGCWLEIPSSTYLTKGLNYFWDFRTTCFTDQKLKFRQNLRPSAVRPKKAEHVLNLKKTHIFRKIRIFFRFDQGHVLEKLVKFYSSGGLWVP